MTTATHFSHLASFNQPKNKLQREALYLLQELSNQLVFDQKYFVGVIQNHIDELNYANQNCTALKVSTYGMGDQVSISLGAHFTVAFHLYPIRNNGGAV